MHVDEADYVGRDVDEVEDELEGPRAEGRRRTSSDNPGDEDEDAVEGVDPTGTLEEGDTVTVTYWGKPPEEQSPPTEPPGQEKKP